MTGRRVLVTGASGLLGTWLLRTVPDDVEVVGLVHRRPVDGVATVAADLRDQAATRTAIGRVRPDQVIHAAYALDEASIVTATRHVADAARSVGTAVVGISTDAVFSGDGRVRAEDAVPDPVADYGRFKAQAERILATGAADGGSGTPDWTIIRLPLIVSLDPTDPVVAAIRRGAAGGEATVWFDDELRQPAMAADLAPAIWRIAGLERSDRSGVWHLPGPETLSRFAIAQRVAAALGLSDDVVGSEPTPTTVVRPRHLQLGSERARSLIGWDPSPVLSGR